MAIEEPRYRLLLSEPPCELREYPALTVAEVSVSPGRKARNRAFRQLAAFIFGGNHKRAKIDMTAPVTVGKSEKIAMTAPVTIEDRDRGLTMRFVMPRAYTLSTLPLPNDPAIKLHELPPEQLAVIRYSGFWSKDKEEKKAAQLRAWMRKKNLAPSGPERAAFYNSPFSLPWFRRNEILIPVRA